MRCTRALAVVACAVVLAGLGCGRHPAAASAQAATRPALARPSPEDAREKALLTIDRARAAALAQMPLPPPGPSTPVAVVIGNDPGARPQAGLEDADVVWEIPAEGFITRYFAIFASRGSAKVGPVRSTRIYFDQLARAYGIPFAHAGGNVDALQFIRTWGLSSLDGLRGAGGYFWRSADRTAPDNLYTSTSLLSAAIPRFGYRGRPLTLPAASAGPQAGFPVASVTLDYITSPAYTYRPSWRWRGAYWQRTLGGADSVAESGAPITAGTVIILAAVQAPDPDPYTPGAIQFLWSRGGQAWVLRDGTGLAGRWHPDGQGLPAVTDASGRTLDVGPALPVWYEVVPSAGQVEITR